MYITIFGSIAILFLMFLYYYASKHEIKSLKINPKTKQRIIEQKKTNCIG